MKLRFLQAAQDLSGELLLRVVDGRLAHLAHRASSAGDHSHFLLQRGFQIQGLVGRLGAAQVAGKELVALALEQLPGELLAQLDISTQLTAVRKTPIYQGGPLQTDRGFVLHTTGPTFDSTLNINDEISVTTSRDVLEAIADGQGPAQCMIALGYAGWGSGQLEQELSANAWLSGPADGHIIFRLEAPSRWLAAAKLLGIDMNLVSGEAGHA